MPTDPFVHLHVASGSSLRYGSSSPQALVARAVELGQACLALTDRDGMYGAVPFIQACQQAGIDPIVGVDLTLGANPLDRVHVDRVQNGRVQSDRVHGSPVQDAPVHQRRIAPARGGAWVDQGQDRVVVLARGATGWASLCRLVSAAHLSGERGRPVVSVEQVAVHSAGLVILLGPDSDVGRALVGRRPDQAQAALGRWRSLLADPTALRIEIVSHLAADTGRGRGGAAAAAGDGAVRALARSSALAARMLHWAAENAVIPVLTNAVRHAERSAAPVIDVLDAIRRLVPLDSRHLDRANAEGYLKSGRQMHRIAREVAGLVGPTDPDEMARDLLRFTQELALSCVLTPAVDLGMDDVHVPEMSVLLAGSVAVGSGSGSGPAAGGLGAKSFLDGTARDPAAEAVLADGVLRRRCEQGLARRGYDRRDAASRSARERLEAELRTIATLGFAGYFLTVAEVVDLIRDMDVRVAARGSGAGSLVNHLLGISAVDPLQHGLLMERFLSPLRRALPDIDVDVESARRTEVYERILTRFGGDRCTCVSMMDTYRVRHAVRDVGAALGLPPGDIDAFAKAFPHIRARDARAAMRDLPELRAAGLGRLIGADRLDRFLGLVESLDGLPRHVALHPCGVLLSDATLLDRTPVEASWQGFPMSQFDKDDVEAMGFLKLDVLGIRMQSAMSHALSEIGRVDGAMAHGCDESGRIDLDAIPFDDPATFALIQSTHTLGCFQIESPGQRELIGKFAPETFGDLITDISLFRPGPVKSDMVTPFLRARQGWNEPVYLHADLIPALEETCGVVVFHEQVLSIVSVFTGCSLAEADETRRSLGSPEGQDDVRAWFYPAALRRGYDLDTVERVWDVLKAFASFGFCKAHAAAFAVPTYQSAWLKAHHPAAFLAGVLTHDPGMYPKRLILEDARTLGIAVLGLDINASESVYRIERVGPGDEPPPGILGEPPRAAPQVPGLPDGRSYGIRLALAEVKGISAAELVTILAGRPYASLSDFWHRAGVSRPIVERLVLAGGFDSLYGLGYTAPVRRRGQVTRRDLLLQVADLDRHTRAVAAAAPPRRRSRGGLASGGRSASGSAAGSGGTGASGAPVGSGAVPGSGSGNSSERSAIDSVQAARAQSQAPGSAVRVDQIAQEAAQVCVQLTFDLGDAPDRIQASGLPEMGPAERVQAELEILGLDVSHHVIDFYAPMLAELGITRAQDLLHRRSRQQVVVAGVKVATQTPPIRSGRRVVFLTLDDATGPIDATFFEDAQGPFAATLFHSWLLLVRGEVRRTGPRGISLRATGCWELGAIRELWCEGGRPAVENLLAQSSEVGAGSAAGWSQDAVAGMAGSRASRPVVASPPMAARTDELRGGQGESRAGGMGQSRRVLVHASGFRQSPYADVKPAGAAASTIPSRRQTAQAGPGARPDARSGHPGEWEHERAWGQPNDWEIPAESVTDPGEPAVPSLPSHRSATPAKLWHSSPGSSGW